MQKSYLVFLFIFLTLPIAHAHRRECGSLHIVSQLRSAFDQKAAQRFSRYQREKMVREFVEVSRTKSDHSDQIYYEYEGKLVAFVEIKIVNKTMRFDIRVEPEWRGLGLYHLAMAEAVSANPGVQVIPSRMQVTESDNAKVFFEKIFFSSRDQDRKTTRRSLLRRNQWLAKSFRRKILAAFLQTPAFKTRASLGFSNVETIILDATDDKQPTLSFVVSKGTQQNEPRIFVGFNEHIQRDEFSFVELTVHGDVNLVDEPLLPDYPDLKR